MTDQPKCSTCRFFHAYALGCTSCRRWPPTPVVLEGASEPDSVWPSVTGDDWCGEHQYVVTPTVAPPRLVDPAWRDRLSTRAKNCLDSEGTADNQILGEHGLAYLMCIRNSGKTIAHEILNKCREAYGLPPHGKR